MKHVILAIILVSAMATTAAGQIFEPNRYDFNDDQEVTAADFYHFLNGFQFYTDSFPVFRPGEMSMLRMENGLLKMRIEQLEAQIDADRLDVLRMKQWQFQNELKTRAMFVVEANKLLEADNPVEFNWYGAYRKAEFIYNDRNVTITVAFDPNEIR